MENTRLVKAKLSQTGLHCSLDWVTAGLSWLAEEEPGLRLDQVVVRLQEQWTLADISVPGIMDRPVLPANLASQAKAQLTGQYSLQVQHGHDIGSPAYGQLQKLYHVDLENHRVSADDSQVSQLGGGGYQVSQGQYNKSWEPRAQRCLMLTITDGVQTVEAMECQPINCLPDMIKPGMKILVSGPVTVRRGILMLQSNSVRVLGGEVEELADEFALQKILQQKIGKDDVGQKESRFAAASSVPVQPPPPPRPNIVSANPRLPQPVDDPRSSTNQPEELFQDDDDDMLLLAASQMEDNLEPQATSQSAASTSSGFLERTREEAGAGFQTFPPEGVIQPLRTITNTGVSQSSQQQANTRKMIAQSSITSFMSSKAPVPAEASSSTATFSLIDSDDEFLADFQYEEAGAVKSREVVAPSEPFQYLVNFNQRVRASPGQIITGRFKVVSSTLASKMSLKKGAAGPEWNVMVLLNDGSDAIKVDISPIILDSKIGKAADYAKSSDPSSRAEHKKLIVEFSKTLATLNCIATIQSGGAEGRVARIIDMEDISGRHLAEMIKRSKLY